MGDGPGNVDSVANVSLILSADKNQLAERIGKLSPAKLALVLAGIGLILGQ